MSTRIEETYYSSGALKTRYYYRNERFHREDAPACLWYREDGILDFCLWLKDGERHREGGPAYEAFYRDGNPSQRGWYKNDRRHREDGPAYEWYHENSTLNHNRWHINSAIYHGNDHILEYPTNQLADTIYCLDGEMLSESEHKRRVLLLKL